MSTPKVLLHLGLPKTATSSLQHNVFQRLHEEQRINFLGKCLDQDYKTGRVATFNYTGKFIRDAAEGNLSIEDAKCQLACVLTSDCLNVFSDEGLMVAYPGKQNYPLSEKFKNLSKIFEGYKVDIIVTLRDPVDYLYSLYVQLYPDFFSKVKEMDSVEKYAERLIRSPNDVLFESFFFRRWLPDLEKRFDVTVFQYSQLVVKDPLVAQGWATVLGVSSEEFIGYFNSKKINVKMKSGKEVQKVSDLKGLESKLRKLFAKNRIAFCFAKWLYNVSGMKNVLSYRFSYNVTHRYPEGEQYDRLQQLLS